jgi:hypothetical protein
MWIDFKKSTYCEYILEKILSTSEVGPIMALIAPSHLIRKIEGHKNKVTKCNKSQSKGENKAPK